MHALILVTLLTPSTALAEVVSLHETMAGCFDGRDTLLIAGEHYNGHFPKDRQAICIHTDDLVEEMENY